MTRGEDLLKDALRQLDGWSTDPTRISRTLTIDESQHADLSERIKIYADTLELCPAVSRRDGKTQIDVRRSEGVSLSEVNFAARVENAYRDIAGKTADEAESAPSKRVNGWWQRRK